MLKSALVTGASKRIGRAIALGLADHGYAVAVHHNASSQDALSLVEKIIAAGGNACAVQANLNSSKEAENLIARSTRLLGPIALLVNNASVFEEDSFDALEDDLWDRHFNIHVRAPAILAGRFAAQGLDEGLIVNIIDQRVLKLTPKFASYTLSKSALWTATKTAAQALAPTIRVNAIGPGPTLPSSRQTREDFDAQVASLLLKRSPELEEFVDTILYFAKTKSVTGQMIALDGGQHLGWHSPDQHIPE